MSDDLTTVLRDLAESAQTQPPVAGAEIRRRAGARRRRRRTAAAAAGACAATALAVTLLLNLPGRDTDDRPAPAATPPGTPSTGTPSIGITPSGTVDLRQGILTYGRRELRIAVGGVRTVPAGRMRVMARKDITALTAKELGLGDPYIAKVSSVLEMRADDGTTVYIGGLLYAGKTTDDPPVPKHWLGLDNADAAWLYKRVRVGDVFDVGNGTGTPWPTPDLTTSPSAR